MERGKCGKLRVLCYRERTYMFHSKLYMLITLQCSLFKMNHTKIHYLKRSVLRRCLKIDKEERKLEARHKMKRQNWFRGTIKVRYILSMHFRWFTMYTLAYTFSYFVFIFFPLLQHLQRNIRYGGVSHTSNSKALQASTFSRLLIFHSFNRSRWKI